MNRYRTHTCSEITKNDANKIVKLSGWIHRKRDHGNLLFFDLRDHYGLTQCVAEKGSNFFHKISLWANRLYFYCTVCKIFIDMERAFILGA